MFPTLLRIFEDIKEQTAVFIKSPGRKTNMPEVIAFFIEISVPAKTRRAMYI
jgi:hypothetical protein